MIKDRRAFDWEKKERKGNLHRMNVFQIINGKAEANKSFLKNEIVYDENKNRLEFTYYNAGLLVYATNYEYDDKEKPIQECTNSLVFEKLNSKVIYKYDDNGNLTSKCDYDSNSIIKSISIYKYDDNWNLTEERCLNANGTIRTKTTYIYNSDGMLSEECCYNSSEKIESKITYQYDDNGNVTEECSYENDGFLNNKWEYKYDEKGNEFEWYEYIFDKKTNQQTLYKTLFYYDNNDNLIEETVVSQDGETVVTVKFKYDDHGNFTEWVKTRGKEEEFEDGEFVVYEYFD